MVVVTCPVSGCSFRTDDLDASVITVVLQLHLTEHSSSVSTPKGPKLDRPCVDAGINQEGWNAFIRRWEAYRVGSGIPNDVASIQLLQCASAELADALYKDDSAISSKPLAQVLISMRALAVIPVGEGILRAELMQMRQSNNESFRLFAARVKGKAETCGYSTIVMCSCGNEVTADYTQEAIRDVLLAGISCNDIRREALSNNRLQKKAINDIIAFVEDREIASKAVSSDVSNTSACSALSTFKRGSPVRVEAPSLIDRSQSVPCPECGEIYKLFKQGKGGWNRKPFKNCLKCWRATRTQHSRVNNVAQSVTAICASQISVVQAKMKLDHQTFVNGKWNKASFREHPMINFRIGSELGDKLVTIRGIADTGAQSNLWGYEDFMAAGFHKSELHPVTSTFCTADKNPLSVVGAFRATLEGTAPSGDVIACRALVYVSRSVCGFFLSFDTMVTLRVLDSTFPRVGGSEASQQPSEGKSTVGNVSFHDASCGCPQRTAVPDLPASLPFKVEPVNIPKMRAWLLDRYASSTFNICPHRPLNQMAGPPIQIHLDESATPRVCNTPAPIPLHWQKRVKEDLLRDEALGVIERVPYGVPVSWCHRMVVTRKQDGSPRRTVDLSPLNKFCKRESYYGESPFVLARRVPGNTWKTVTDAWNGYHSVLLRESDRHLTTFITPYGRYRYTRAPQGFLSSGDGYNRRFESILSEFLRRERCVDDTIYYDEQLSDHWWRTMEFLSTVGAAGIVLNPDKFQFCERVVDFAGFRISDKSIEPLPRYLDAIRTFPVPNNITDIRSWFGLVNQVSSYAQLRDVMAPFRKFLSPKTKFYWDQDLQEAFIKSKADIVNAIREGVRIFDTEKATCLRPDWSGRGIGYFLMQKHCLCLSELPDCCQGGWRITLAGSRFLSDAEKNYAAIEGEALAIAWGLENTRFFTQGCDNLVVVTDHKPLTKIFGDRTLDEIPNTRLFRLKQRTLPWHFRIAYLPGRTNTAADAASRYPNPHSQVNVVSTSDSDEPLIMAAINGELDRMMAITWETLGNETNKDPVMRDLKQSIREGFLVNRSNVAEYTRYKHSLYIANDIVLYQDRVVIPPSLRKHVLETLHSAHQGVLAMKLRAQSLVFWPRITRDIEQTRDQCGECNRNAPTQAALPAEPFNPPATPFEQVFADFFEFAGRHYLVVGDRLSGWTEIYSTPSGSQYSGAKGLVRCLRSFFMTFGVPEEVSSDGGPEFVATTTQEFLSTWHVRHRISSAYCPWSNGRAEVAVKAAKRLLRTNVGPTGSLDNDKLLRAMLQLRNTPDADCNVSPAEIIFGRPLRDAFLFCNRREKFSNRDIRSDWRQAWALKELALRKRFTRWSEGHDEHIKTLKPLKVGQRCFVQNQHGHYPKKWDRSGLVVEALPHNQYTIKIDGSGRLSKRNRRFLRFFKPASSVVTDSPRASSFTDSSLRNPVPNNSDDSIIATPEPSLTPCEADQADVSPEPVTGNDLSPTKRTAKPALALRKLEDFNSPGLKIESPVTTRLRPRR